MSSTTCLVSLILVRLNDSATLETKITKKTRQKHETSFSFIFLSLLLQLSSKNNFVEAVDLRLSQVRLGSNPNSNEDLFVPL